MGNKYLTWMPNVFRNHGLQVIEMPGADTAARRSGGYNIPGMKGVGVHHTASGPLSDGLNDARYICYNATYAPISNLYISRRGVVYYCAAGATNTEGAGGPMGDIPRNSANPVVCSLEIANNGRGERYPDIQENAVREVLALLWAYLGVQNGWHSEGMSGWWRLFAHFEWAPSRKIDPYGPSRWNGYRNDFWKINDLRGDVMTRCMELMGGSPPPPEPPPPQPGSTYTNVTTGLYTRKDGEWAWRVSVNCYGNGGQASMLEAMNPGVWFTGRKLLIPNKPGRTYMVKRGEGPYACIRGLGRSTNATMLERFYHWNGGVHYPLQPGEIVYLPDA